MFRFSFVEIINKIDVEAAGPKVPEGYRGYPQNTHPLCIAAVFENSPEGYFGNWFWFRTAFERAHKAGIGW